MPVIINQLETEIVEPVEIEPELAIETVTGSADAAQCFRTQMELVSERAERLKVD